MRIDRDRRKRSLGALMLLAVGLIGTTLVRAEVVADEETAPAKGGQAIHQEPVALECWQNGRRIIHREGLSGLTVKSVSQNGAVAFEQQDGEGGDLFLLPFEDGLCLVGPEG